MKATVIAEGIGRVDVSFSERGAGQPVLLLHGGGGPASVIPWADLLAAKTGARVVTPTHPGLGTPRPDALTRVGGLARVYAAIIDKLELDGVSVMGRSIGPADAGRLGDDDGVVDREYGRAYARAISGTEFTLARNELDVRETPSRPFFRWFTRCWRLRA
jgi:pimeloyl-ACP methyl ester carboxylesterase